MNRSSLAILPLLALPLGACTSAPAAPRAAEVPIAVRVESVRVERMAAPILATGTLAPRDGADLSFKVGGVIARVLVEDGARVRAGQLLAALDLGEIDPALARAEAAAEKSERDWRRAERLYADSVATLAQLQDAGTARQAAVAERDAARFNRSHALIVAPADGVVLRRLAEPGEVVGPGRPVFSFGSRARGQVLRVGLPDRDLMRIRIGDHARVAFEALPDRSFAGTVSEVGAAADPVTGTYGIEIALDGADGLASGLIGSVEIRPRAEAEVALVPIEALVETHGDDASVFTLDLDGRRAERRPVRLAFVAGDLVAIRSGLEGVESVVTDGAGRLDSGDLVEVRP